MVYYAHVQFIIAMESSCALKAIQIFGMIISALGLILNHSMRLLNSVKKIIPASKKLH